MARIIALTQFVFVSLGTMALTILMKTQSDHVGLAHNMREFLTSYGLWMLLIPVVWTFCAEIVQYLSTSPVTLRALNTSGIIIASLVLVVYGWLILSF